MGTLDDVVQIAINGLALVDETPHALRARAVGSSLADWRVESIAKVSGMGLATGFFGGFVGLGLEAADLAVLFKVGGKACFGIGYILDADVDTDTDIHAVLAIWSGAAESAASIGVGKVGFKAGGKVGMKAGMKVGGKVLGKLLAKAIFKTNAKLGAKLAAKVAAKIAAKLATKAGTKWIPLFGGAVSAGINWWVIDGLMDAAEQYYRNEYIVLSDEAAAAAA